VGSKFYDQDGKFHWDGSGSSSSSEESDDESVEAE
jgi:hypothetical protein